MTRTDGRVFEEIEVFGLGKERRIRAIVEAQLCVMEASCNCVVGDEIE